MAAWGCADSNAELVIGVPQIVQDKRRLASPPIRTIIEPANGSAPGHDRSKSARFLAHGPGGLASSDRAVTRCRPMMTARSMRVGFFLFFLLKSARARRAIHLSTELAAEEVARALRASRGVAAVSRGGGKPRLQSMNGAESSQDSSP